MRNQKGGVGKGLEVLDPEGGLGKGLEEEDFELEGAGGGRWLRHRTFAYQDYNAAYREEFRRDFHPALLLLNKMTPAPVVRGETENLQSTIHFWSELRPSSDGQAAREGLSVGE